MDTVLLCGGCMEEDFVKQALEKIQPDCVIGIDKGLEFCYRNQIVPQYILGDFDSIDRQVLAYYENQEEIPVKRYQPEKDASDTRIGLELALKLKSTRIFLLGATGGRLDHYMANLQSLLVPLKYGAQAWILDPQNAVTVLDRGRKIRRQELPGKYVSFFSMGDRVEGITLTGFKYPLTDYTLNNDDGIAVSNELAREEAEVSFTKGRLLMIFSKDKA
ncbi:MAG TPA: thiamine diphosphokinase [Candidatus Blautia merdavium]|uniref:Thiamine diphosphokinase n=1 Tax=Candidatus Blautia merdavium TaxID=2838494 RepID=A0A9D2TBX6_9FIRM|nr:thiamine diphosphokinase [Candidatus Blautia merdavium]